MDFLNRKAIKAEARAFIRPDRKWFSIFLAILPYAFISNMFSVAYSIQSGVNYSEGNYYQVQGSSWSFIGNIIKLIAIPFGIAAAGYMLNHIRGFNPEWKSLYVEGKDRFGKYFEVGFITGLITFLWSLLFIIPGIVKGYAYSQVSYIIHDNPNLSTQDVRKISDLMTKGYKGELFVKDLSFILWYMLILCTLGIATIYVTPYMMTVNAMYYENLKNHAIEAGIVAPEAFGIVNTPADENNMQGFDMNSQPQFTGTATTYTPVQPADNGYQAPQNNMYQPPVNNAYQAPVNNGFEPVAPEAPEAAENSFIPKQDSGFADDSNMEFDPAQKDITATEEPSEFDGSSDVNG